MQTSSIKFSKLLTEAIRTIRLYESKPISIIQDELGYILGRKGGTAIDYWRRGNIPSQLSDLEQLAAELVKRGKFKVDWLEQFLYHGNHPNPQGFCKSLFPYEFRTSEYLLVKNNLPSRDYRQLIGRENLVNEILAELQTDTGEFLVTIEGMGGIGKTALVLDIAYRCAESKIFEAIVWITARSNSDNRIDTTNLAFGDILDAIAVQLGLDSLVQLPVKEKTQELKGLLQNQHILIIIDNLETSSEHQDEIASQLKSFLNPSKAILTSRHRFGGDFKKINLLGLESTEALNFIRQDAAQKGLQYVQAALPEELEPIIQVTGGSPLALKLVISQLAYLPIEIVLDNLKHVRALRHIENGGGYVRFYKFVFLYSWSFLTPNSQHVLVAMAKFMPMEGAHFEAIKFTSNIEYEPLIESITQLWKLSFIERGEIHTIKQMRYYLHPLTRNFIFSDIVQMHSNI